MKRKKIGTLKKHADTIWIYNGEMKHFVGFLVVLQLMYLWKSTEFNGLPCQEVGWLSF